MPTAPLKTDQPRSPAEATITGDRSPASADGGKARARSDAPAESRLLRIQEVAAETGLTPRSIRYYEEVGLLRPAARSEGAYRLYDASDLERLQAIKRLRDDAGLSLQEIGTVLEDEDSRMAARAALKTTDDPIRRAAILRGRLASVERLQATLTPKLERLKAMVDDVAARRQRLHDLVATAEAEASKEGGEASAPDNGQSTATKGSSA